jgi:hypothetical protein
MQSMPGELEIPANLSNAPAIAAGDIGGVVFTLRRSGCICIREARTAVFPFRNYPLRLWRGFGMQPMQKIARADRATGDAIAVFAPRHFRFTRWKLDQIATSPRI